MKLQDITAFVTEKVPDPSLDEVRNALWQMQSSIVCVIQISVI